jgi:hypothetical protein
MMFGYRSWTAICIGFLPLRRQINFMPGIILRLVSLNFTPLRNADLAKTGNADAETGNSSDDEDSYWEQYDQYTGRVAPKVGESGITPEEPDGISGADDDGHYSQYDNVETAIDDSSNLMHGSLASANETLEPTHTPQGLCPTTSDPLHRNEIATHIGLDEYITSTVRSMCQLALRSGMTRQRLTELVNEGISHA